MLSNAIFFTHVISTFMWFGIIWFVQLIHYPLLYQLGHRAESEHYRRTMPLAVSLLSVELVTGTLLLWIRPATIPLTPVVIGLALLAAIWISTWSVCVPCHQKLHTRKNIHLYQRLMSANLFRAILWSLRVMIVIWMLMFVMK